MSPPSSKFSQASQVQNVLLRNDLEEEEGVCYVVPATVRSRLGAAALRKPGSGGFILAMAAPLSRLHFGLHPFQAQKIF